MLDDLDNLTLALHECENQVLGALFTERETVENILAHCSNRDFTRAHERKVFECLCARITAGAKVAGRVEIELRNALLLDDDYDSGWISRLEKACSFKQSNHTWNANELRRLAVKMRLAKHWREHSDAALVPNSCVEELIEEDSYITSQITSRPQNTGRIEPVSIRNLIRNNPELRPVVVDGILRRGETANIIAAAKVGKSFLALFLAWCIAVGRNWLSHEVTKGRVLIIDNELHPETLASRLYRIADGMQIDPQSDAYQNIDVICLRGDGCDINALGSRVAAIEPGTYTLVIVDALYRTLPAGTSENDNAEMMAIYNRLDYYAAKWDAAIAVVHHSSKGAQGDKSVTDVGSGAGAISRAADTHIVIRQHEDPELCVLETATRSFKSPEPVSIRFTWPLWEAVTAAPEVKRVGQRRDEKTAQDDREADKLLLDALRGKWLSESQLVRETGMGPSRISRAIGRAVLAKTIDSKKVKRQNRRVEIYTTATATATGENISV